MTPSISDLLASATAAENDDELLIIAGAFNLYYTAISKLGGRKHLGSDDIRKLFEPSHIKVIFRIGKLVL